jgi:hypothetical protein
MTRFLQDSAIQRKKFPLFSRVEVLALQIFPNFFLAEMGKINALRAKKFGFVDFRVFQLLLPPRLREYEIIQK